MLCCSGRLGIGSTKRVGFYDISVATMLIDIGIDIDIDVGIDVGAGGAGGAGGVGGGVSRRTSSNAPPFTRKDTGKNRPSV